jgi:hypothetical protein
MQEKMAEEIPHGLRAIATNRAWFSRSRKSTVQFPQVFLQTFRLDVF